MAHDLTPHPRRHQSHGTMGKQGSQRPPLPTSSSSPSMHHHFTLHLPMSLAQCARKYYIPMPPVQLPLLLNMQLSLVPGMHAHHTVERVAASCLLREHCTRSAALPGAHHALQTFGPLCMAWQPSFSHPALLMCQWVAAVAVTVFRKNLMLPAKLPTKQLHTQHTHGHNQ